MECILVGLAPNIFGLVARLPPDSLAGRAFYGSYAPLVPWFGASALAVHAAILGLPPAALALTLACHRRAGGRTPSSLAPLLQR